MNTGTNVGVACQGWYLKYTPEKGQIQSSVICVHMTIQLNVTKSTR